MTTSSLSIQVPYLPTTQSFPTDPKELQNTLSKRDTDIVQAINTRTIGIYNTVQVATGNKYYTNQNTSVAMPLQYRQSFRQLFSFGAIAAGASLDITHGISGITQFVSIYGSCITDASVITNAKYEPIPFVSTVNIDQQVSIYINDTIITITNGSGNNNILSGTITLEYLLN